MAIRLVFTQLALQTRISVPMISTAESYKKPNSDYEDGSV